MPQYNDRMMRGFGFPKTRSVFFGRALIMLISFVLTFQMRGLLPFSGAFSVIMRLSLSISVQASFAASPDRIPVSLSSWRNVDSFFPALAISASNSSSLGTKGILLCRLVLGFSQVMPYFFA